MPLVLDASIAVRWFVHQEGHEAAKTWLLRLVQDPVLLVAPDLLRFEVFGILARHPPRADAGWSARCLTRFDALGIRTLPTTRELFVRAIALSRELCISGYDAVYLAHAESLDTAWLTADQKALRRLAGDARIRALE
jgi:predicted nucleic acid-binding protein